MVEFEFPNFTYYFKEIKNFEVNNWISVIVLGLEGKDIYVCHHGRNGFNKGRQAPLCGEVNLLLISNNDVWHYMAVKSLSRLLASRNSRHKSKQHFCKNCLQGFKKESSRNKHYSYCINNESVKVEMPTKSKSILKSSDYQNQLKMSFMIYADFESILEPIQGCNQDPTISHTDKVNKHTPSGFCTYSIFAYGNVEKPA